MTRRIVTAREQEDLRTPWRTAMPAADAYDNWKQPQPSDYPPVSNRGAMPQASPDAGTGPWYHGTDYSLPDGTMLTPGGGRSRWDSWYGEGSDRANRPQWVWLADNPDDAQAWGSNVYEVSPQDEGPWPWNGSGTEGHVSPRAQVVQRVDMGKRRFERLQREKRETRSSDPGIAEIQDLLEPVGRTGRVTIPYIRNNNGLRRSWGETDFGMEHEPWGRYMTQINPGDSPVLGEGWEQGEADFDNPLHLDYDYGNWKQRLSDEYGGATGQELSDALLAAGHDAVLTGDRYGPSEFVDIRPKDQRVFRTSALPPGYRVELMHSRGYGDGIAGVYGPRVKTPGDTNWQSAISWDSQGVIRNLDTKERHRGKGLARGVYEHVRDTWRPDLMHDHALSPDGRAFADAVGGLAYDDDEYQHRRDQADQERKLPWEERNQLMRDRGWPEST